MIGWKFYKECRIKIELDQNRTLLTYFSSIIHLNKIFDHSMIKLLLSTINVHKLDSTMIWRQHQEVELFNESHTYDEKSYCWK